MSSSLLQLHSVHAEPVSSPLPAANLDLRACHSRAQEISDIEGAFFRLADYRYRAMLNRLPKHLSSLANKVVMPPTKVLRHPWSGLKDAMSA